VGPWLDARLPVSFARVAAALSGAPARADTIPLWGAAAELPDDVFAAGLAALADELHAQTEIRPRDRETLLRAAHGLGPSHDVDTGDDVDPDAPARDEGWTAADVAARLRELVTRTAAARRRGAWLRRLAHATIEFHERVPRARHRVLSLCDGEVVSAADVPLGGRVPRHVACERPPLPALSLDTYDRLRVLTTELRRLVASDLAVTVYLGRRVITGERLARTLAWV
jgi:hypothetical protein